MNQNKPSKMKKLLSGNVDESIKARLPRGSGAPVGDPTTHAPPPRGQKAGKGRREVGLSKSQNSVTKSRVLTGLYVLILLMLIGTIIWQFTTTNLSSEIVRNYGLPLLASGYLVREIMFRLAGDITTDAPPPEGKKKKKTK